MIVLKAFDGFLWNQSEKDVLFIIVCTTLKSNPCPWCQHLYQLEDRESHEIGILNFGVRTGNYESGSQIPISCATQSGLFSVIPRFSEAGYLFPITGKWKGMEGCIIAHQHVQTGQGNYSIRALTKHRTCAI